MSNLWVQELLEGKWIDLRPMHVAVGVRITGKGLHQWAQRGSKRVVRIYNKTSKKEIARLQAPALKVQSPQHQCV